MLRPLRRSLGVVLILVGSVGGCRHCSKRCNPLRHPPPVGVGRRSLGVCRHRGCRSTRRRSTRPPRGGSQPELLLLPEGPPVPDGRNTSRSPAKADPTFRSYKPDEPGSRPSARPSAGTIVNPPLFVPGEARDPGPVTADRRRRRLIRSRARRMFRHYPWASPSSPWFAMGLSSGRRPDLDGLDWLRDKKYQTVIIRPRPEGRLGRRPDSGREARHEVRRCAASPGSRTRRPSIASWRNRGPIRGRRSCTTATARRPARCGWSISSAPRICQRPTRRRRRDD